MFERDSLKATIIVAISFLYLAPAYTQDLEQIEKDAISNPRIEAEIESTLLSLNDAIEIGLRKNIVERTEEYVFEIAHNDYKDAYYNFYFPRLSIFFNTTNHSLENLYRDQFNNNTSGKTPTGSVGIGFDDFTLFNWGKDYLDYINAREIFERKKALNGERKRDLRFQIIAQYFNLVRVNQNIKAYKKQLRQTSFIYRLAKEKRNLKKIKYQELLQAKSEFLNSHQKYQEELAHFFTEQQKLANLLGDSPKSNYKLLNQLKFKPLAETTSELISLNTKKNTKVLDAKLELENSNRSYSRTLKENLPLPKISMRLGAYRKAFDTSGLQDEYRTFGDSNNVELSATVSASWTIFGSGGFLNSRVKENAYFQKKIAEIRYFDSIRETKLSAKHTLKTVEYLEKKYKAVDQKLKNATTLYDRSLDNYIAGRTSFANLKHAIETVEEASLEYEYTKYMHLYHKVELAQVLGLYDFPGEKFEELILR